MRSELEKLMDTDAAPSRIERQLRKPNENKSDFYILWKNFWPTPKKGL